MNDVMTYQKCAIKIDSATAEPWRNGNTMDFFVFNSTVTGDYHVMWRWSHG